MTNVVSPLLPQAPISIQYNNYIKEGVTKMKQAILEMKHDKKMLH